MIGVGRAEGLDDWTGWRRGRILVFGSRCVRISGGFLLVKNGFRVHGGAVGGRVCMHGPRLRVCSFCDELFCCWCVLVDLFVLVVAFAVCRLSSQSCYSATAHLLVTNSVFPLFLLLRLQLQDSQTSDKGSKGATDVQLRHMWAFIATALHNYCTVPVRIIFVWIAQLTPPCKHPLRQG
ncbi:hypothetical protein V8C42DRAFT_313981 [Trichoderma barbatum]